MRVRAYKRQARVLLRGKILRAVRIRVIRHAVLFLSAFCGFALSMQFRGWAVAALQAALLIFSVGVIGSVSLGEYAWKYRAVRGGEPSSVQMIFWLRRGRGYRAFALQMQLFVRKAFWLTALSAPGVTLLFFTAKNRAELPDARYLLILLQAGGAVSLCAGIVCAAWICQKYALSPMLLSRKPHASVRAVLAESAQKMNGACGRLMLLKASFIPSYIACGAVLPMIYCVPHAEMTVICMLRDVLNEAQITERAGAAAERAQ